MAKVSRDRTVYLERYKTLIVEIKERTLSLGQVADGRTALTPVLAREFCHLQLRMICECIALACLVAHGDIAVLQAKKFQQEWSADKLMTFLDALDQDFYPVPATLTFSPGHLHVDRREVEHLTKSDLKALVQECGGKLHRGPLRNYEFAPSQAVISDEINRILAHAKKIISLLESHRIPMIEDDAHLICWLSDQNGAVCAAFAEVSES